MSRVRISVDRIGLRRVTQASADMVEKVSKEIADDVRSDAPVDTGALRGSVYSETETEGNKTTGRVGYATGYGIYVEEGTSRMAAQPTLKPALYKKRSV